MNSMRIGIMTVAASVGCAAMALAEEVTLTTYYPSPRGVYRQLQTTENATFATAASSAVGIGTATPTAGFKLDVASGGARIAGGLTLVGTSCPAGQKLNAASGVIACAPESDPSTTNELQTITAGAGLTGGGSTLAVTLDVAPGAGITTTGDQVALAFPSRTCTLATEAIHDFNLSTGAVNCVAAGGGGGSLTSLDAVLNGGILLTPDPWSSGAATIALTDTTKACGGGQAIQSFDLGGTGSPTCVAAGNPADSGWTDAGAVVQLTTATDSVGIGTTSPTGKLTVSDGTDNVDLYFAVGTPRLRLRDALQTDWEIDSSGGSLRIFQPGSVKMTINGAGRVDVTSPDLYVGGARVCREGSACAGVGGTGQLLAGAGITLSTGASWDPDSGTDATITASAGGGTVTAGNGLTGGGALPTTLHVGAGTGISVGVDTVGLAFPAKSCGAGFAIQAFDVGTSAAAACIPTSGSLTGSGSLNILPKWTGATSLGNSQVSDDGIWVRFGGTMQFGPGGGDAYIGGGSQDGNLFVRDFGATTRISLNSAGDPKLDVNGTTRFGASGTFDSWIPYVDNNVYLTGSNIFLRGGLPQGWVTVAQVTTSPADMFVNGQRVCRQDGTGCPAGGGVGPGTTNRVAKFTTGSTVGNSSIIDNGVSVQITSAGLYNAAGFELVQTNATDWTRWNQGQGSANGNAMYQSLSLGTGGLAVGTWSNQGVGNIYATGNAQINGTIRGATYGFGGMFYMGPTPATCYTWNPFTGACTCPSGFSSWHMFWVVGGGGGGATCPTGTLCALRMCYR